MPGYAFQCYYNPKNYRTITIGYPSIVAGAVSVSIIGFFLLIILALWFVLLKRSCCSRKYREIDEDRVVGEVNFTAATPTYQTFAPPYPPSPAPFLPPSTQPPNASTMYQPQYPYPAPYATPSYPPYQPPENQSTAYPTATLTHSYQVQPPQNPGYSNVYQSSPNVTPSGDDETASAPAINTGEGDKNSSPSQQP